MLGAFDAYHALGVRREEAVGAWLVCSPATPAIHDANHVRRIRTPDPDVPRLLDEAERRFGALPFRSFRLDAHSAGRALEARLALDGYTATGELLMVLDGAVRGSPADVRLAPVQREADWAAWRALKHRDARTPWFAAHADEWTGYVRGKAPAVGYAGAWDGETLLGSFSHFVHERVGYVEDLLVAPEARLRGVGTALVAHCVDEARRRGADLVFVPAATHDTPKTMYARMGFTPVATTTQWLRHTDTSG